jgi:hypothetical protein
MEKLEEQKANLNEIKTKAESHQKLLQKKSETNSSERNNSTIGSYKNPNSNLISKIFEWKFSF